MVVSSYGIIASSKQKNTILTTRISWMPWRIISLLFNEKQRRMELQKSIKDWKEKPPIPRYIGECFLKMQTDCHLNRTL